MLLPDPVLRIPEPDRTARTWGGGPMMQVQGVGAFVRVLLPIRLTGGYSLTLGTWLAIHPDPLKEVWEVWNDPSYVDLSLEGFLANAIAPWNQQLLAAPAIAQVRDPDQIPYVTQSSNELLEKVLMNEWPHEQILGAYAGIA